MEGIFLGKIDQTAFEPRSISLSFRTKHLDQHVEVRKELDYDRDYVLVKADDVITTNDELLKLREKVKKLEAELAEIKTARTLREAYITGVEKGCESLREERDAWKRRFDTADKENQNLKDQKKRLSDMAVYWNNRFTSVMTDFGKVLEDNGITFEVKNIDNDGNWDVGIDIPELTEAKKKIAELETKLKITESRETYWRDRKEEEEDHHHYWLHTFNRVVKLAADIGVNINVCGMDKECNVGIIVVDNAKAAELKSQVTTLTDSNKKLNQQVLQLEKDYQNLNQKYGAADNALEYWNNTYNDIVIAGKKVGVKIDIKGKKSDSNAGFVYVTNEMALDLAYKLNDAKQEHDRKWQAMLDALKNKGVEVIYMGEQNDKPIVDVKIPAIDILRKDYVVRGQIISDLEKELKELKSNKVATCTLEAGADGGLKFIYTYMDDHNEPAHINCLCKNHVAVDAESISHGTTPTCKSCGHYMHNRSRFGHDWCYMPIPKEGGAGYIRKLSKEESEGPACSDYKARKE